jgi:hypothetical protein
VTFVSDCGYASRHYQRLHRLLERPEALTARPVLVRRLQRLRDARARLPSAPQPKEGTAAFRSASSWSGELGASVRQPTQNGETHDEPSAVQPADFSSAEGFRQFHAAQLQAQTDAAQRTLENVRSIRAYVQLWFWLTVAGALLIVVLAQRVG